MIGTDCLFCGYRFSLRRLLLSTLVGVAVLSRISVAAGMPKLVAKYDTSSGVVAIQLQQVEDSIDNYRVEVIDLIERETVGSVTQFTQSPLKHVYEAKWEVPKGYRVLAARVVDTEGEEQSRTDGKGSLGQVDFKGEYVTVRAEFDFRNRKILWDLGRASLSRVIVATPSGLPLAKPYSWAVYSAGSHSRAWDFRGEDGFDYSKQPFLVPYLQTIPLPSNWFVCEPIEWNEVESLPEFRELSMPSHTLDFELETVLPSGERTPAGEAVNYVPGMGIRMTLSEESAEFVSGRRFEILVYLNGEFIHEESQGSSPFLYVLPETLKGTGGEILSVNVLEYEGSWGTRSMYLDFTEKSEKKPE